MPSETVGRVDPGKLGVLHTYTGTQLGPPETWPVSGGGYPDSLALAILDTIFSVGANYDRVVLPLLRRYRDHRRAMRADPARDGARELADAINVAGGPDAFADAGILDNHQRAWRRKTAPLKTAAALHAATAFVAEGINSTSQFVAATATDSVAVERVWRTTPGQRSRTAVGWDYLRILAGGESVKADTMIRRYVAAALRPDYPGIAVAADEAKALVQALASQMDVRVSLLDHAIWAHQRTQR